MEDTRTDLGTEKVSRLLVRLAIPTITAQIVNMLYNIVDRIFVGNYNGTSALAGLSICFPLSYLMIAFGLTCSAGGSSLFSLFAGRKEQKQMNRSFGNALVLAVVSELILTVLLLVWMDPVLRIFGVTQTAYAYAADYYRIVALGCLFQGLTFVFCDFVRVSGRPLLGMCVTGIGAVTNIVLDAVFVAGLGMGVTGAAWATVLSQLLSGVLNSLWYFFRAGVMGRGGPLPVV